MKGKNTLFLALLALVVGLFALSACSTAKPITPPSSATETDWRSQYDYVSPFREGRAWVEQDGNSFYIDVNGKRIE